MSEEKTEELTDEDMARAAACSISHLVMSYDSWPRRTDLEDSIVGFVRDAIASRREQQQGQECPDCGHPMSRHDPEDGTCDVHADSGFGVCQCGRSQGQGEPIRWLTKDSELVFRELRDARTCVDGDDSRLIPLFAHPPTREGAGENADLVKRLDGRISMDSDMKTGTAHDRLRLFRDCRDALSRQPLATPSVTAAAKAVIAHRQRYNDAMQVVLKSQLDALEAALTSESTDLEERARKAERYLIESGCPGNIPIAEIILRHFGGEA